MKFSHFVLYFPILNLFIGWIGFDFKVSTLRARAQSKLNSSSYSPSRPLEIDSNTSFERKERILNSSLSGNSALGFIKTKRRLILPVESQTGVNSLPDR